MNYLPIVVVETIIVIYSFVFFLCAFVLSFFILHYRDSETNRINYEYIWIENHDGNYNSNKYTNSDNWNFVLIANMAKTHHYLKIPTMYELEQKLTYNFRTV